MEKKPLREEHKKKVSFSHLQKSFSGSVHWRKGHYEAVHFETWGESKGILCKCCTLSQAKNRSNIIRSVEAQYPTDMAELPICKTCIFICYISQSNHLFRGQNKDKTSPLLPLFTKLRLPTPVDTSEQGLLSLPKEARFIKQVLMLHSSCEEKSVLPIIIWLLSSWDDKPHHCWEPAPGSDQHRDTSGKARAMPQAPGDMEV